MTCEGPNTMEATRASSIDAPSSPSMKGSVVFTELTMKPSRANMIANTTRSESKRNLFFTILRIGPVISGISLRSERGIVRFSGRPINRCVATQNQTAHCQPNSASSKVVRGQEIEEEKPAKTVIPAMTRFDLLPKKLTAVAKAAS